MAAMATVNINLPDAVLEAARSFEDLGLGFTLAAMLPASRTANDAAMRAILEALTPAQRADLACLGANLVELINEIGEKQWEAEREKMAAEDRRELMTPPIMDVPRGADGPPPCDCGDKVKGTYGATGKAPVGHVIAQLYAGGYYLAHHPQRAYEATAEPGPECYDCETSGVNCRAHRTAEERRRADW